MTTSTKFHMKIADIFHFGDGRAVFVGIVENHENIIHSCVCELLVEGVLKQVIRIEGEMMPEVNCNLEHRSISSKDKINLDKHDVEMHECILQEIES